MIDWYLLLTPLLVLLILLLFRFVGCERVFQVNTLNPPFVTLAWEGLVRDRVGQGKLALAPDGALDGTLTVTLGSSVGLTVTALKLNSYLPDGTTVGTWDTDINSTYFVLGASTGLDDPLLNDPANASVNFVVAEGGVFVVFASDFQDMEFLSGNTLELTASLVDTSTSNRSTESVKVVIP